MLSVIKTAIITIIISFISGVLLDNYKNFAPRILCTMRKAKPMKLYNKRIKVYMLTIRNTSNKTLHNLNVNVQGHGDNLKVDNPNISNGLKFDMCNDNDDYDISIPFLSRDDQFTAKLLIEQIEGVNKKPIVTLRSPENFKEVNSKNTNGFLSSLFSSQDNKVNNKRIIDDTEKNESFVKSLFTNKKLIISVISILLVAYVGILGGEYYNKIEAKVKSSPQNINNQPTETPKDSNSTSSNSSTANVEKDATDKSINTNNKDSTIKYSNETSDNNSETKSSSSNNKTKKTTNNNPKVSESNNEASGSIDKNNQQENEAAKNNSSTQNNEQNTENQNSNNQKSSINSKNKSKEQATKSLNGKPSQGIAPGQSSSPGPSAPTDEAKYN